MKFKSKLFLSIFLTATLSCAFLSSAVYYEIFESKKVQFIHHYLYQLQTIRETIAQIDESSDRVARTAALVLREIEASHPLPSNQELAKLAQELDVAHVFAMDQNGRFIRSTNGDPKQLPKTLFDYCNDYRKILTGESKIEQTPITRSTTEATPGPFKYTMIANHNYTKILEVGVSLEQMHRTLRKVLNADHLIESLTVLSPNGAVLSRAKRGEESLSYPSIITAPNLHEERSEWLSDQLRFTLHIPSNFKTSGECEYLDHPRLNGKYFYVLDAVISTQSLHESLYLLRIRLVLFFAAIALFSAFLSAFLSKKLVRKIETIRNGVTAMAAEGKLDQLFHFTGNDEMDDLGTQIDSMAEKLKKSQDELIAAEKKQAFIQIATQVAHDIRSPLAALQIVAQTPQSERSKDHEDLMDSALDRIREIANDLLEDHKEINHTIPSLSVQSLQEILTSVVKEMRIQTVHQITLDLPKLSEEKFFADPKELKRILSNIIQNAVEATPSDGNIDVSLEQLANGKNMEISIQDNGKGIPPSILNAIGTKSFSYGKPSGSGLGLFHAKKHLQKWSGTLKIDSELTKGTKVTIRLVKNETLEALSDFF